jgi:hypothetical protein
VPCIIAVEIWTEHAVVGVAAVIALAAAVVAVSSWWFVGPRWTIRRRIKRGRCPICNGDIPGGSLVHATCPRCGADVSAPPA